MADTVSYSTLRRLRNTEVDDTIFDERMIAMNNYVTGAVIKQLREQKKLTQTELGQMIGVSDKTVSKWETARGLPDISLVEPIASALGISVSELFAGEHVINSNRSGNLLRSRFYICPICGNVIHSLGEVVISCCGVSLPPEYAEDADDEHQVNIEKVEDEYYLTIDHEMTKQHYISFIAFVSSDKVEFKKLYPECNAQTRLEMRGHGILYWYCNRHGLMKKKV